MANYCRAVIKSPRGTGWIEVPRFPLYCRQCVLWEIYTLIVQQKSRVYPPLFRSNHFQKESTLSEKHDPFSWIPHCIPGKSWLFESTRKTVGSVGTTAGIFHLIILNTGSGVQHSLKCPHMGRTGHFRKDTLVVRIKFRKTPYFFSEHSACVKILKGTVSWDRFQKFQQKYTELGLTKECGWFMNFLRGLQWF